MFEQAREAMEASIADKASGTQTNSEQSSHSATNELGNQNAQSASKQTTAQELVDLEKLERFRYEGRELTPAELKKLVLMQSDYTKKTQALSEERKTFETQKRFVDNLEADLEAVRKNPALRAEFEKVYPLEFHKYLSWGPLSNTQDPTPQVQQNAPQESNQFRIPPELEAKLSKVDELENYILENETKIVETKLETLSNQYRAKYNMADELNVLAAAMTAHSKGMKLDDKEWEKIWKADHDRTMQKFESYNKQQTKKQLEANRAGRDVAGGGGIPGQAPQKRTFKQATEAAINELSNRSRN